MRVWNEVRALDEIYKRGETRFWVNDDFPGQIDVAVLYDNDPEELNDRFKAVAIVDGELGGMFVYGKPEEMEKLAHDLNKLDALERIARASDG